MQSQCSGQGSGQGIAERNQLKLSHISENEQLVLGTYGETRSDLTANYCKVYRTPCVLNAAVAVLGTEFHAALSRCFHWHHSAQEDRGADFLGVVCSVLR